MHDHSSNYHYNNYNNNNTYLYSALFTLCSNALLKNTVITLLNTDRSYTENIIICFWRVILLSNVTPSILTYSLTSILSLPTTRHCLSPILLFVQKITNSVLSSLSFNALRRIQSQMSKIQFSSWWTACLSEATLLSQWRYSCVSSA